jgi:nucleotide-binding universal stress UspA family protein
MLHASRILVGFQGHLPDDGLIRYAAMVARINEPELARRGQQSARRRRLLATGYSRPGEEYHSLPRGAADNELTRDVHEVRFVSMLSRGEAARPPSRGASTAKVRQHFAAFPQCGPIQVDLLKGRPLDWLAGVADDFDADVLLLDNALDPRRNCARLAVTAPCAAWLVPTEWAPVLRRILVPIDFSCRTARSLQVAIDLANRFPPAKCVVLYVDTQDSRCSDASITPARQRELTGRLRGLLAAVDIRGASIEPMFVKSHHVDLAIDRAAAEHSIDLTVMICRRRGRLANAIHPSLAESVIRQCQGPVLLLKSTEETLETLEAVRSRFQTAELVPYS